MRFSFALILLAVAARVWATPILEERAAPKIYLAGDSTMAPGGGGKGTNGTASPSQFPSPVVSQVNPGWGGRLKYSLKIPVINDAKAGRSARSYTVEGHFNTIAARCREQ